jgi:hypothetical protein
MLSSCIPLVDLYIRINTVIIKLSKHFNITRVLSLSLISLCLFFSFLALTPLELAILLFWLNDKIYEFKMQGGGLEPSLLKAQTPSLWPLTPSLFTPLVLSKKPQAAQCHHKAYWA